MNNWLECGLNRLGLELWLCHCAEFLGQKSILLSRSLNGYLLTLKEA